MFTNQNHLLFFTNLIYLKISSGQIIHFLNFAEAFINFAKAKNNRNSQIQSCYNELQSCVFTLSSSEIA